MNSPVRHSVTNRDFLAEMFRTRGSQEAPWVAGFPGDPHQTEPRNWAGRPVLNCIPWCIQPGNNNYVCVSTFRQEKDGSWRRRKANFSAMHAIMIDDIGTKISAERLVLEPSALVETSPGNFQAWYFLAPPETDAARADLLVKRMIEAGLTADARDPGMRGVTRYGRLPVGRNGKSVYLEKLGAPFIQKVHRWEPGKRYRLEQIAQAYGIDLTPEQPPIYRPLPASDSRDSLLPVIQQYGLYLEPISGLNGAHRIVCPWSHEHTGRDTSGTVYFEPGDSNGWHGGFKCHHGHCMNRGIRDLERFIRAAKRMIREGKAA